MNVRIGVYGKVAWTPKTEPAIMRASLQARIGQVKLNGSQKPQSLKDHQELNWPGAWELAF